jgi:hypothetical protein
MLPKKSNYLRRARARSGVELPDLAVKTGIDRHRLKAIELGAQATVKEWALILHAAGELPEDVLPLETSMWEPIQKRITELQQEQEIEESYASRLAALKQEKEIALDRERSKMTRRLAKENEELERKLRLLSAKAARADMQFEAAQSGQLVKELNIPPDYHKAGVTILQGFISLLQERFPGSGFSSTIRQDGLKLTLIVHDLDGKKLEVSEFLDRYALVVMGHAPISTVTANPISAIELRHQLELAKTQISTQREINSLLKSNHDQRIRTLELRERWMQDQIGYAMTSLSTELASVISLLAKESSTSAALAEVQATLEKPIEKEEKASMLKKSIEKITTDGLAPGVAQAVRALIDKLIGLLA